MDQKNIFDGYAGYDGRGGYHGKGGHGGNQVKIQPRFKTRNTTWRENISKSQMKNGNNEFVGAESFFRTRDQFREEFFGDDTSDIASIPSPDNRTSHLKNYPNFGNFGVHGN